MSTSTDITEMVAGLRGDQYVSLMRGIHADALASGGSGLKCAYDSEPATLLGMQRCGHPGPPVCQGHWDSQQDWMRSGGMIANTTPWCRHCGQHVTSDHIYVVALDTDD